MGCGKNTSNKAEVIFIFMLESLVELEPVLERLENYQSVVLGLWYYTGNKDALIFVVILRKLC
jgi:hypothetical protein